jgi:UDP-N-acetylmuramoyl-tripeptide--D-alanyl-D-alanine ligase
MMTLAQAQHLLPGSVLVGDPHTPVTRVHSDSRSVRAGDLFVAIQGENFDGHDFLARARVAGAAAALASHGLKEALLPGLQVPDTLLALQTLAAGWRRRCHLPLAAVTGSNGKTTVTQMTASILRAWQGECAFATQGNLNNHIGLPLTLLRLRQDDAHTHRVGVVELGMNQPGEVAMLSRLAAPTVALVNNAQREHQEFMHTVQAVAEENGSVIDALPASGVAVFPADDAFTPLWRAKAGPRRTISFALEESAAAGGAADVRGRATWHGEHWHIDTHTPAGAVALTLHMPGRHHAKNALAATACALALGAPLAAIAAGIAAFQPVAGRSALRRLAIGGRTVTLVDDSYNANPDSVAAAIRVLAELPAPRWLVLGDMGEVGAQGPAFHQEVGTLAAQAGIEHLWCVGVLAETSAKAYDRAAANGPSPARARHFDSVPALNDALREPGPGAPPAAAILVKGSRFMAMERVVGALSALGAAAAPPASGDGHAA